MNLNLKKLLAKILQKIATTKYAVCNQTTNGVNYKFYTGTVASNSSGLINLTALGAHSSNCSGLQAVCTTSNYVCSNPILWSNGDYYVTLYPWNGATPQANKSISIIVSWFEGL